MRVHLLLPITIIATLHLAGCDSQKQAARTMQQITDQVAADAVKQYDIAKRNGATAIDICVQAGMVSAAYLQAHDEANYGKWKDIEKSDCETAGVPR